MTKWREWCEEAQVDRAAAIRGRIHELGEGDPIPGDALGQGGIGYRFDVSQIPRGDFAIIWFARRDADAAITHHNARDAVPRSATDQRIPTNLRVVVSMWIDEARRDDQLRGVDLALRAFGHFADLHDAIAIDRHIPTKPRCAGPIDD